MAILNLKAAALLLHIHPQTLRARAASGLIPGAKIGRAWVFVEVDIIAYVRAQYDLRVPKGDHTGDNVCHFSSVTIHPTGGSKSLTKDDQYSVLLGLPTSAAHRNTMTK